MSAMGQWWKWLCLSSLLLPHHHESHHPDLWSQVRPPDGVGHWRVGREADAGGDSKAAGRMWPRWRRTLFEMPFDPRIDVVSFLFTDDPSLPASMRCKYNCDKLPTGPLDRKKLLDFINEQVGPWDRWRKEDWLNCHRFCCSRRSKLLTFPRLCPTCRERSAGPSGCLPRRPSHTTPLEKRRWNWTLIWVSLARCYCRWSTSHCFANEHRRRVWAGSQLWNDGGNHWPGWNIGPALLDEPRSGKTIANVFVCVDMSLYTFLPVPLGPVGPLGRQMRSRRRMERHHQSYTPKGGN